MKKVLFFLTFSLSSIYLQGQETLITFENSLKTSGSSLKDVIPIVNDKTDDLVMFIADAKNVYGYKFDSQFNLQKKLTSIEKSRKFKILIGSDIQNEYNYRIFLTNKNHNAFASIQFSFKNSESTFNEFQLRSPHEKFIQTVSYKNKFFLITAERKSPADNSYKEGLYIYTFDINGKPKRNKVDLSSLSSNSKDNIKISLTSIYNKFYTAIKKFENNVPAAIETVSSDRKMYLKGSNVIFTFDKNKKFTYLLEINLENFQPTLRSYNKPLQGYKKGRKKTNSFINGNKIFTIASTKEKFGFRVNNFDNGEFLKEYNLSINDSISFKNTAIIQKGGMYDEYREMESTKKFLRKITAGRIGISAIKLGNKYQVTIGGYVEQGSPGMMPMGGFGGLPIASVGSVNMFFNPTIFAFNSMANTKSTYIECLFDENFNHVKGKIKDTLFDRINSVSNINSDKGETIFKYKDYFILGEYNTYSKKYTLTKFTD